MRAVATELEDGHNAVYVDLEDSALGIASRLLDLGVPAEVIADPRRFAYVRPDEAFRDDVRAEFWVLLSFLNPSLVVLDSTGESMALEGTDPNSDDGVAQWFRRVAAPITGSGPAVLLLDHLPKSDNAAASPIGSQRKRAAISGVQMIQLVKSGMTFKRGRAGEALLTCTKDRHGNFVTGETAMTLIVNPEPARGEAGLNVVLARVSGDEWAPTRHMLDVSTFLEKEGTPQSTGAIKKKVKGKAETLTIALQILVESGYVSVAQGSRNATLYSHVAPYTLGYPFTVPDGLSGGDSSDEGCGHPWHQGQPCNPDWCHATHHGSCNDSVLEGHAVDLVDEVVFESSTAAVGREGE